MKQDKRKPQYRQSKKPVSTNKPIVSAKKSNNVLFIAIAFCLPVLLYLQTLGFKFTYFDDDGIIINNIPFLSNFSNARQAFLTDAFIIKMSSFYRPLQTLSYMIDIQLSGGNNEWMYHLTNIFLLGSISVLIYLLFKRFSIPSLLALLGSLIYCVHPLFVSSVAWIPARGDLLLTFFSLLSFLFLIEFLQKGKIRDLLLNWGSFTLALFSKETAALLPLLFILYYFAFSYEKRFKKKHLLIIVLCAVAGILWYSIRSIAIGGLAVKNDEFGLINIISNLRTIPESLAMLIIPFDITIIPIFSILKTLAGLGIIVLIIVLFLKNNERTKKEKIFCFAWFLLLMLPPMFYKPRFLDYLDHRFFLPLIGILLFLLFIFPKKWLAKGNEKITWIMIAVLLFLCSSSFIKSAPYISPMTFYSSAITQTPNSAFAYNNRANYKCLKNDLEGALDDCNKAIVVSPTDYSAYYGRGVVEAKMGDFHRAFNDYNKAISMYPLYIDAYNNRGLMKSKLGDKKGAIEDFDHAISLNSNYANAYSNKGCANVSLGNFKDALDDFNRLISLSPYNADAYYYRGSVKINLNNFKSAIEDLSKAISIRPKYEEAYYNRGFANLNLNNFSDAITDFDDYISLNPNNAQAYGNRAFAKYSLKDIRGAMDDCNKAIRLNPHDEAALQLQAKIQQEIHH